MSEDLIKKYLDARTAFFKACEEWEGVQMMLQVISWWMLDPFSLKVKGEKVSYPELNIIDTEKDHFFPADEWFDGQQIVKLLLSVRETYDYVLRCWEEIPDDDRNSLVPPPDKNTLFNDRVKERNLDQDSRIPPLDGI